MLMQIPLQSAQIDREEMLRYLGHNGQEIDQELLAAIEESCVTIANAATARAVTRRMTVKDCREDLVTLEGTDFALPGRDIAAHLAEAKEIVMMAVTLGTKVDQSIDIARRRDMMRSLLLDAAASAAIESACNVAEEMEAEQASQEGFLFHGSRFSPGYGDLPLSLQPAWLELLNAGRQIGLTCSPSLILLPRKSVTAVFGLYDEPPNSGIRQSCDACTVYENCILRKNGRPCWQKNGEAER